VETEAPIALKLELLPRTPSCPWHAVLENAMSGERLEFDTPLALLQHLEQLALRQGGKIIGIR
jgi:hypothetical protein